LLHWHSSNWSLPILEPVSSPRNRKLEKSGQRPVSESRVQRTEIPEVVDQRPVPTRNVDAFQFGENSSLRPHCLADDAVLRELVSRANSLRTGKFAGNPIKREDSCRTYLRVFKDLAAISLFR